MPILPHDALISPAAKERWLRWRSDLKSAERKSKKTGVHPSCWRLRNNIAAEEEQVQNRMREQHTLDMLRDHPSLLQTHFPEPFDDLLCYPREYTSNTLSDPSLPLPEPLSGSWLNDERINTSDASNQTPVTEIIHPHAVTESSRSALINSTQKVPTMSQYRADRALREAPSDRIPEDAQMEDVRHDPVHLLSARQSWGDGPGGESAPPSSAKMIRASTVVASTTAAANTPLPELPAHNASETSSTNTTTPLIILSETPTLPQRHVDQFPPQPERDDHITDTVGAIAVDSWGKIACGASSGGIGMKYRGRVGPAALVGVGAAVIPIDNDDSEQTCVATVTSGTGEHMATTMAATVCAERLYQSVKKGKGGEYVEVTEDEALRAMIENEFMGKHDLA